MALDEATTALLSQMQAAQAPALQSMTPQQAREMGSGMAALYGPGPEMSRTEDILLATIGGTPFRARTLIPRGSVRGVLVYYHGGGWVLGDIDQYDTLGRMLADRTGCAVVMVDYRKAPEHPYPAAVDDAWTALVWAAGRLPQLAGKGAPLMVGGDSSGGNLAALMALRARDNNGPHLTLQILVYPVTDADLDNLSYRDPQNQLMLSREVMVWFWDHYVADAKDRASAQVSPARAATLAGLPPAVVITAEHDVLREEGERYAEQLSAAGVPVQSRRFDGQMHGFFSMVNLLPGNAVAVDYVAQQIVNQLSAVGA